MNTSLNIDSMSTRDCRYVWKGGEGTEELKTVGSGDTSLSKIALMVPKVYGLESLLVANSSLFFLE